MSKRWVWLLLVVFLAALCWALLPERGAVGQQIWVGWRGEARHNAFYLAQRVLKAAGMSLRRRGREKALPSDKVDAVVVRVLNDDAWLLDLRPWLEQGGVLLIGAQDVQDMDEPPSWLTVHWQQEYEAAQDDNPPIWVDKSGQWQGLTAQWRARDCYILLGQKPLLADEDGCAMLAEVKVGQGRVLLAREPLWQAWRSNSPYYGQRWTDGDRLPIQQADNAVLLVALLGDAKQVWWLELAGDREMRYPLQWGLRRWLPVWGVVLLLGAAVIWRFGRRFGGLRRAPVSDAVSGWAAHFDAAGRYLLAGEQQLALRDAALAQLRREAKWRLSEAQFQTLQAVDVSLPQDFVRVMARIAQLRAQLVNKE